MRFGNALAQTGKSPAIRFFHAQLDSGLLQRLAQFRKFGPQRQRTQQMKNFAQQLEMHRTNGLDFGAARFKVGLLLHDAAAHVPNHGTVFAAQAPQFQHLLRQITAANVHGSPGLLLELANAGSHCCAQNLLALPHHPLRQRLLQPRQLAGMQQVRIAGDFGNQPFLRRHRNHLRLRQTQDLG